MLRTKSVAGLRGIWSKAWYIVAQIAVMASGSSSGRGISFGNEAFKSWPSRKAGPNRAAKTVECRLRKRESACMRNCFAPTTNITSPSGARTRELTYISVDFFVCHSDCSPIRGDCLNGAVMSASLAVNLRLLTGLAVWYGVEGLCENSENRSLNYEVMEGVRMKQGGYSVKHCLNGCSLWRLRDSVW